MFACVIFSDSWVNCNDSRMILSSLEEVLTAQAYILFYKSVHSKSIPESLTVSSNTSTGTVSYSLKSEDTVCLPENGQSKSGKTPTTSPKSKVPKALCRQSSLNSSLSNSPMPTLLQTLSSSSSSNTEKYSLKTDGTEILTSDELDELDCSWISNKSVQIVDKEISFNFKSDSPDIETKPVGSKRSLDSSQVEVNSQDCKRKKLSFDSTMSYSHSTYDGQDKNTTECSKDKMKSKNRRRTRSMKDDNDISDLSLIKFEKFVKQSEMKEDITSGGHIKRRKSTFW